MDESLPPPMAPPPRPKPKPGQASGANSANNNVFAEQNTQEQAQNIANDNNVDDDAKDAAALEEYFADRIEEEEFGEACEWHLPGMMEGTYVDPHSVPAKYLVEQEFLKMRAVAEELGQLLQENKKRHDKKQADESKDNTDR